MSDVVIQVRGLGKRYWIQASSGKHSNYRRLSETLTDAFTALFKRAKSGAAPSRQDFWALRGVSFDVKQGDVLGVIGRNGAGKSTLLKIMSRITDPTEGGIDVVGRVGSLLEVGTGFHPELTGRENIYLSGAILGMSRSEIERKFDQIVAFSEIERFLDTPAKRYSSGMYMRLAFAVAAHLEPEILLVDEVLAVGDASFQKKCLNKMEGISHEGRTILFISHDMAAVTRLCPRALLLNEGKVIKDGPTPDVISTYLQSGLNTMATREWRRLETAPGNDLVRLRAVRVRSEDGEITNTADIRRSVGIEMEFDVLKGGTVLVPNFHIYNEDGVRLFVTADLNPAWRQRPRDVGHYISTVWIPGNFFSEGTIVVEAAISTMDPIIIHCDERDVVAFQVVDSLDGDSARGDYAGPMPGLLRPLLNWTDEYLGTTQAVFVEEKRQA